MKKITSLLTCSAMVIFSTAQNVGINESSPSAKLEIKGTGSSSATTALQVKNSTSSLIMKVRDDGNIGLGYGTPAYRLDVQGRMRVRGNTGDIFNSAGIWLDDYRDNTNAAFIGMMDSIRVGFWGDKGAGWQWNFDTKTGNVGMGRIASTSARLSIDHPDGATANFYNNGSYRGAIKASDSTLEFKGAYSLGFNVKRDMIFWPPQDAGCNPICLFQVPGNIGFFVNKPNADVHINGDVLIGSTSSTPATGYKLSINGKAICTEMKVQLSASWPDYVFENSYNLPSLDVLEKKVMEEKHLPNIPSAGDVASANGIELGQMQNKLLEKVEELYRYVFQLNNENKQMKEEIKQLKRKSK